MNKKNQYYKTFYHYDLTQVQSVKLESCNKKTNGLNKIKKIIKRLVRCLLFKRTKKKITYIAHKDADFFFFNRAEHQIIKERSPSLKNKSARKMIRLTSKGPVPKTLLKLLI